MSLTLEQSINRKNNNFNLIRLLAAVSVVYAHSFSLFPSNGYSDPVKKILLDDDTGALAVMTFFFLSGIFITASFNNSKSLTRFTLMRVFRIYPALIICTIITVFIIGPIVTDLTVRNYFVDHQTWKYLIVNFLMFKNDSHLPGVFGDNFFKGAVNGSLWTLPAEIKCYFLVALFGVTGLLKRNITVIFIFIVFILFRNNHYILKIFFTSRNVLQLLFFLAGMLSYTLRKYIIIDYKITLLLTILCSVFYFVNFKLFLVAFYITFINLMLLVGTSKLVKKIDIQSDYSYGIYIYGFLVQQVIAHYFHGLTTYTSILITLPITWLLGVISWHWIEYPALNIGKKLSAKKFAFPNFKYHDNVTNEK
jgi:peptidoglycan/LPS O-acetylase OafA/YrhL